MARHPRIYQDEYPYHITTRTARRVFAFNKQWTYKIILDVLVTAQKRYGVRILHFKMMHTHYHMICVTPGLNVSDFAWYVNHTIARRINARMGQKGHLWSARFSATIIQTEEYLAKCDRYLYINGVRVGHCAKASEDDQLSTFDFYARGKKIDFTVTEDHVYLMMGSTREERQAYFIATMDEPMGAEEIRAIKNGLRKRFYGSADFIEKVKLKYARMKAQAKA